MVLISNLIFWVGLLFFWIIEMRYFYVISILTALITILDLYLDHKTVEIGNNGAHYHGLENIFVIVLRSLLAIKAVENVDTSVAIILFPLFFYGIGSFFGLLYYVPVVIGKGVCCKLKSKNIFLKFLIFFFKFFLIIFLVVEGIQFCLLAMGAPMAPIVICLEFLTGDNFVRVDEEEKISSFKNVIYYSILTIVFFFLILAFCIIRFKVIKRAEFARNLKKNEIPVLKNEPTFLNLFQISPNLFSNNETKENQENKVENTDDDKLCVVCFEEKHNTIFDPCGHGGVCGRCAKVLCKKKKECPLCREVANVVLIYMKTEDGRYLQVDEIE